MHNAAMLAGGRMRKPLDEGAREGAMRVYARETLAAGKYEGAGAELHQDGFSAPGPAHEQDVSICKV